MNLVKNTAVILVILAGVIGSYFILKNPDSGIASGKNDKISELSEQIFKENPIQWIERVKEQIFSTSAALGNSSKDKTSSQQLNLTDLVAKQMFGGMQSMIQDGGDSAAFNPDDPKNIKAIQSAISGIQDPLSYYDLSIDEKAINIFQGDSEQGKMNYLEGVSIILTQNETDAYKKPTDAVDKAILSGDSSGLNQLVKTYQNLFNGFMDLSVPAGQLELHKKYLKFFKKAGVVYWGISDVKNDPVKASLFFKMVPDIISEEIEIRKEYYKLATS
ncbi:MAG: hypothetical protein ABIH10_01795 [Spirochaetota bacterium]